MKGFKFPVTYADLDAAPWCARYKRLTRDSASGWSVGTFIYVGWEWLPHNPTGQLAEIHGDTLSEALLNLRELWDNYMHPPLTTDNDRSPSSID
jgi:hypothetical protein